MAEQELKQLRQKLETQEREFQNYRDQCKTLETFLEEESGKKEKEIRKLKEEAINKQKNYKLIKTENAQLLSDLAALRSQLARVNTSLAESNFQLKIQELTAQLSLRQAEAKQSKQQLAGRDNQLHQAASELQQLKVQLAQKQQQANLCKERISSLDEAVQSLKRENEQLFARNSQLQKMQSRHTKEEATLRKGSHKEQQNYQLQFEQTQLRSQEKLKRSQEKLKRSQDELRRIQEKLRRSQEKLKRSQDKTAKMEKAMKQLRSKLDQLQADQITSPSKWKQDRSECPFKMYIGCLIMTKQHYLSPFLEVSQQSKTVRLFKAARNGCFEKALGSTKHTFSMLSYSRAQIVEDVVRKVKSCSVDTSHLILLFGTKKSAKKNTFAQILAQLYDFLAHKLKQTQTCDCSAVYIRRSYEQLCHKEEAFTVQQILQLLQKLMNADGSELKRIDRQPSAKKTEKPRVCYMSLKIDEFALEVATSSFSNIVFKQKDDASTFYNNVLYSKLPDVLQSSFGEKYLIFTLNPIVDLYEDCRNILNATVCKSLFISPSKADKEADSPSKELLNLTVRRKLEHLEREAEQSYFKLKRAQDECGYYRCKFSELEERLKKLIATHSGQNYYLKKSPILLAYEKMLKFIHSVQAKSQLPPESSNLILLDEIDFEANEEDFNEEECL